MFKELLVIPNYQLSHSCMSHNIFHAREGLQGFVENMGCNYPTQQHRGSAAKATTRPGGDSVKSQSSLDFRLSSFSCPQVSMLIKRDWGEKICQASTSQREMGFDKAFPAFSRKRRLFSFPLCFLAAKISSFLKLVSLNPSWGLPLIFPKNKKPGKTILWHKLLPWETSWC